MDTERTEITVTGQSEQVTLINVFTVAPERQDELVAALDRATRDVFVTLPGFVSANLHASLDGARVINYAQWASERRYREALSRADVREHLAETIELADGVDPTLARVRSIHHPAG